MFPCVVVGPAGSSYPEFIQSMHLPAQLAEVDPIVASFCGGAVGVVSALLVVEVSGTATAKRALLLSSGYSMSVQEPQRTRPQPSAPSKPWQQHHKKEPQPAPGATVTLWQPGIGCDRCWALS